MKTILSVSILSLLAISSALADTPARPPVPAAAGAAPEAPLNPRWEVPSVTISGLTVWTFRPGHFVRSEPAPSPSRSPR